MKYLTRLFILAVLFSCLSSTPVPDNDEAAIKAVLHLESEALFTSNYDAWRSTFVQEPRFYAASANKGGRVQTLGWQAFHDFMQPIVLKMADEIDDPSFSQYNMTLRIHGNTAWAYFDQTSPGGQKAWEHRVLEKVNGEWKIVSMITLQQSSWD